MSMGVYLAFIHIFGFAIVREGGLHLCGVLFGCPREGRCERGADPIERLVLGERRVPCAVAHSDIDEYNTTNKQNPPRRSQEVISASASKLRAWRTIPIHIAKSATTTSSPPKSANAPASRPNRSSNNTHTGRITDPANSVDAQRRLQRSLRFTYGWKKAIIMASSPNSIMCA